MAEGTKKTTKAKVNKLHLNPFNKGVTYQQFLKAIGNKSIATVLKDTCSADEIAWIESEVEQLKNDK